MGYHEHDSLLDHKESEALSEEDRKAAWTEYEAEKKVSHAHTEELWGRQGTAPRTVMDLVIKYYDFYVPICFVFVLRVCENNCSDITSIYSFF